MRIITGSARGRKLKAPKNTNNSNIRPTSDSVKEAIFSAIQFDIGGAVVADLFAGTGQLGIEALSRGAKFVFFADNSPESIAVIRENLKLCGFTDNTEISPLSAAAFLKKTTAIFDIAFLDPPYGEDLINRTLPDLIPKINENGLIVCEYEKECRVLDTCGNFKIRKTYKHGKKFITIYGAKTLK
ncbi:MAG: 16S rRNA (guanine(966)-N(2))-methyltransferase RsmD [Oscillospiraceae bacterium]|jgi:16S rRNA (guanine(966)-N(2))-methyltransferase RsmD|nr:16S rRNA (guanine(966)-N(2))-methyltransferase RsmD [Oscillospiraceae bacterium]